MMPLIPFVVRKKVTSVVIVSLIKVKRKTLTRVAA